VNLKSSKMKIVLLAVIIGVILIIGSSCSSGDSIREEREIIEVPVRFESSDGLVKLLVPEGSLPEGSELSFEEIGEQPAGFVVGPSYKIGPEGTIFKDRATLVMQYDPDKLPAGVKADDLAIARQYDDNWVALYTEHDANNNSLTTTIGKLSTFGVIVFDSAELVDFSEVEDIAREIYQTLENEECIVDLLTETLSYFAPVFDLEVDKSLLNEFRASGIPYFLDFQADLIASGYYEGTLITIESFFDTILNFGMTHSENIGPISYAKVTSYLDDTLSNRDELLPTEVLPALVMALGQERARRYNTRNSRNYSSVWGDDDLDFLQFTLLNYAFFYAAEETVSSGADFEEQKDIVALSVLSYYKEIKGFIGKINKKAKLVMTVDELLHTLPIIIRGYNLSIDNKFNLINQKGEDVPTPYETPVTVSVTFEKDPIQGPIENAIQKIKEFFGGVEFPDVGPQSGMQVLLELDSNLAERGQLRDLILETGSEGSATTTLHAYDEPLAPEERGEWQQDSGYIRALTMPLKGQMPFRYRLFEYVIKKDAKAVQWIGYYEEKEGVYYRGEYPWAHFKNKEIDLWNCSGLGGEWQLRFSIEVQDGIAWTADVPPIIIEESFTMPERPESGHWDTLPIPITFSTNTSWHYDHGGWADYEIIYEYAAFRIIERDDGIILLLSEYDLKTILTFYNKDGQNVGGFTTNSSFRFGDMEYILEEGHHPEYCRCN